jgi:hypothetical protein
MAVFGAILSLANVAGTLVFLFLLIFLVLLEASVAFAERLFNRNGYSEIFDKLKKELMILGIISFTVFIYESSADQSSSKLYQWFLGFEIAHIIVLFMALSFIVQALILVQYASSEGRNLVVAVRKTSYELIQEYKKLESTTTSLYQRIQRYTFFHLASWVPLYPSFRDHIEYKIIERFFLRQHKLPREFKFSKYANALFKVNLFDREDFCYCTDNGCRRPISRSWEIFHHLDGSCWRSPWLSTMFASHLLTIQPRINIAQTVVMESPLALIIVDILLEKIHLIDLMHSTSSNFSTLIAIPSLLLTSFLVYSHHLVGTRIRKVLVPVLRSLACNISSCMRSPA